MKKLALLMAILLCVPVIYAQTIVTTVPQCKNALLEEYTGIHCGYCPDGHRIAELIRQANPAQVVLINIHQGGYANPAAGEPDFRTIYGDSLASQAGVTGYPNGTVNRHIFPKLANITALNRGAWSTAANEITTIQSPVNIGFTSSFDTSTRELTVDVEVYYTQNSPASTNYLNVALLENHVIGYQSDYANGTHTDYDHKHIMRHLITGQWGDKITRTSKGTLFTKTYKYIVPSKYVAANCDVVVYVAESRQEIYTGVEAPAIGGTNNGEGTTYIGELAISGSAFKKGMPAQASAFNVTAQSAFVTDQDFIMKLTSDAPSGWTGSFTVDGTPYTDSAIVTIAGSSSKNISISATPGSTAGLATYTLSMKSVANPTAGIKKYEVYVISGITDLIVNNDASWGNDGDTSASTFQQVFMDGLQNAGITSYGATSLSVFEKGFNANALNGIKNIFYNVGWSFPGLTDSNVAKFESFLDKGGNLFMSGQDIGWETFNTTNTSYATTNTKAFVSNYLKAGWTDDGSTALNMLTPVTGEVVFIISGSSSIVNVYGKDSKGTLFMYPDIIFPVSPAKPVFCYNNDISKVAAVRNNNGVYKTVFLAVSLEMIGSSTIRNEIMKLAYDWFEGKISSVEYDQKMAELMGQGFPNPAVDYTIIPLKNIEKAMLLEVTDLNGKLMQTVKILPGSSSVKIDCSSMPSGIYTGKLSSKDGFVGTTRIVVSK
jgi:hypothetical protein